MFQTAYLQREKHFGGTKSPFGPFGATLGIWGMATGTMQTFANKMAERRQGLQFAAKNANPGLKIAGETSGYAVLRKKYEPWRREAPGFEFLHQKREA